MGTVVSFQVFDARIAVALVFQYKTVMLIFLTKFVYYFVIYHVFLHKKNVERKNGKKYHIKQFLDVDNSVKNLIRNLKQKNWNKNNRFIYSKGKKK